jgi:hypothetical protein
MTIESDVLKRFDELAQEFTELARLDRDGYPRDDAHAAQYVGWMAAAGNVIELICPSPHASYRRSTERIVEQMSQRPSLANVFAAQLSSLLGQLRNDAQKGLIGSVARAAQAETLDDLLDQAALYAKERRKEGAGVLATAVFEDAIRRIVRATGGDDEGKTLEPLINALVESNTITRIVAKRCKAAAGVRNSALHARWDEFTLDDVNSVIALTRELLAEHLAS